MPTIINCTATYDEEEDILALIIRDTVNSLAKFDRRLEVVAGYDEDGLVGIRVLGLKDMLESDFVFEEEDDALQDTTDLT